MLPGHHNYQSCALTYTKKAQLLSEGYHSCLVFNSQVYHTVLMLKDLNSSCCHI